LPIMFGGGTGSEVMQRIAAPMVGGMVTAPLLSMFVIPAAYRLLRRRALRFSPTEDQASRTRRAAGSVVALPPRPGYGHERAES
jgi:AcrB/AcrD/AcrF family